MWKILKSKELFKTGFLRVRVDECQLPGQRVMPRYYVMEFPDWVNVVPITSDGKMVLLRQYRHAAQDLFLEVPGGSLHPGQDESPLVAGQRELLEETGHEAGEWIACGHHYPNPALMNNRMHTFIALNCRKVADLKLDPYEDLEVTLLPLAEAVSAWRAGKFKHSLISASIALAVPILQQRGFKI